MISTGTVGEGVDGMRNSKRVNEILVILRGIGRQLVPLLMREKRSLTPEEDAHIERLLVHEQEQLNQLAEQLFVEIAAEYEKRGQL